MSDMSFPRDQQIREEIASHRGRNIFVQASAGTGKTTLIVDRVIDLVRSGVSLDRIAVVTFTKAAAAELRLRIRERLLAEGGDGTGPWASALSVMPGSWISTIHRFAGRILREYFNLTGVDPAFSTTEGHFTPDEIGRLWDKWILNGDEALSRFHRVLSETSPAQQKEYALLIERLRWLESAEMLGGCTVAEVQLNEFLSEFLPAIEGSLRKCLDQEDRLFISASEALQLLRSLPDGPDDSDYTVPGQVLNLLKTRGGRKANWVDLEEVKDTLSRAFEEFLRIAPSVKSGLLAGQTWGVAGSFAEMLRERWDADMSRLSFDDLLFLAWRSVSGNSRLSGNLRERFDHILIDEFQDTSMNQVRLFTSFLEKSGRLATGCITVVADDKQSIYGWRSADIETFRRFRDRMAEEGALLRTVTTNFRSTGAIVRFVNGFGKQLFQDSTPEEERFGCDYAPICPGPDTPQGSKVRLALLPGPEEFGDKGGTARAAEVQARWFADHVEEGMESGESPGDYALLFRAGTHIHRFVEELEVRGIPYYVDARRDFRKRQEIIDLREIIRCLLDPADILAWLHVLRSDFFGLSDREIHQSIASGFSGYAKDGESLPTVASVNRELRELRRTMLSLPLADFLYVLYFHEDMVTAAASGEYQMTRTIGNLQYIFDSVLSGETSTPHELLEMLDEERAPMVTEEPSVVPPEGGAVMITTIHRSKGLAWRHVVLAAPGYRSRSGSTAPLISYEHENMAAINLRIPIGRGKLTMRTPYWESISSLEKARSRAEYRRLLYVAVTRPRETLSILCHKMDGPGNSHAHLLWQSLSGAMETDPDICSIEELDAYPDDRSRRVRRTCNAAAHPYSGTLEPLFSSENEPVGWKPSAPRIGDMVHEVMEKVDLGDPTGWFEKFERDLLLVYGEYLPEIRDLVMRFFSMELPFSISGCQLVGREYPCYRMTSKGAGSRYIDLLLRSGEGMVVVDFKTDSFEGRSAYEVTEQYLEKQRLYIRDVSQFFGTAACGYLVFLREGVCFAVT